jgi:manganese/zinc/iron transport system substrate-binding protein
MGRVIRSAALFALALMAACGRVAEGYEPVDLSNRQLRVVATTGMVADLVINVGGDRVAVDTLMGPGIDPHGFKASERDVIALADADIIFYNGLHLEAKMADVFERMRDRVRTVGVAEAIDESALLSPPGFDGQFDPHVWFDVDLWTETIPPVVTALSEIDPARASAYERRGDAYAQRLARLDRYVEQQTERVPPDQRVVLTAHDAFNYFGEAYGYEVRGLQGISTAAEAGTADVRSLADLIVERKVPAVFIETSVSTRFIEAVQEAVGARGASVDIGGELFSDALGDAGTPEGTYVGMVRHNTDTIVAGLSGEGT